MRYDSLDHFRRINSPIHRMPAWIKLAAAMAVLLIAPLVPDLFPWTAVALGCLLVVAAAASRIPVAVLAKRLLLLEFFAIGVTVLSLFQPGGPGIALRLIARVTICLFAVVVLSITTSFNDILRVLRRLHFPAILITTLALLYRYVFVLGDEAQRMSRALRCRTFRAGRVRIWRMQANAVGLLFVRATDRAERVYRAMTARGWSA